MKNNFIIPEKDLGESLLGVKLPGRYVGGEYGSIKNIDNNDYMTAISFPDLYEIGMSNHAVKIVYREFNAVKGVVCDRVFAPDKDFENLLREKNIPLYTLDHGIPLNELDFLGFTIGYELCATTILSILDSGKIPLLANDRTDTDPLVVAGGPAITNPLPFSRFLDGVFIGEVETNFEKTLMDLRDNKRKGGSRKEALEILNMNSHVWTTTKHEAGIKVTRAVWNGFVTPNIKNLPVANISAVQDNGIIEIMRGCPHSCRFCHAGFFYRPYRQKDINNILAEADFLVNKCGYNDITLSSLSSGDYKGLKSLIKTLNTIYGNRQISFSLPSLRINTFTLSLLKELSIIRKSGLTFAVETPEPSWQKIINKEIDVEKIVKILKEAKKLGWKVAKFYFMIGLPVGRDLEEEKEIAKFIDFIQSSVNIRLNVNVGTFIPKPHTPFQWSYQLNSNTAFLKLHWLKNYFKRNSMVKLSYHTPFVSFLEGILSRGDERVGDLILRAYKMGAHLDAWSEYFNRDLWAEVISTANWDVEKTILGEKGVDDPLPWSTVDLGVNSSYIKFEYKKSINKTTTSVCDTQCNHLCGICNEESYPRDNGIMEVKVHEIEKYTKKRFNDRNTPVKYIFEFEKKGKAVYLSHINVMNIFQKAIQRAGILLEYSKGYNPKPKLEFAHPLSLGITSVSEIASALIGSNVGKNEFITTINSNLPSGFRILRCKIMPEYKIGMKKNSLMSIYGGSGYRLSPVKGSKYVDKVKDFYTKFSEFVQNEIGDIGKKLSNDIVIRLENMEAETSEIYIFIPATGTKTGNITYLLKEFLKTQDIYKYIKIHRVELLARDRVGNLRDYFNV